MAHKHTNRLIDEKSPYLLQHAHNPVDWFPWGQEAFDKAKDENKPIFLSVGYSTCHWCHVMEHESFENEAVADIMNKFFVNIKVDREENPGVDKLYMTYVQLTSGGGGWPMSVFLTPELNPFFGATYFPPEDQFGKPGFKTLLKRIAQLWNANPDKVIASGKNIIEQIRSYIQAKPIESSSDLDPNAIAAETYHHFENSFDAIHGGFGGSPKFPTPVQLQFLLDYYMYNRHQGSKEASENAQKALDMALFTLRKIAAGGIHDHVGSGFHRYSTDNKWHVPHFEKMLYDQAQLMSLYSSAYQITGDTLFANVTRDIICYVSRDLQNAQGGFYSAEDADSLPTQDASKKLEGAFCVWEAAEIQTILGQEKARVFNAHYHCQEKGNIDPAQDPHQELVHKNVLMEYGSVEDTAKATGMTPSEVASILKEGRAKLWEHRSTTRPKPHRDEKIITSWNGLMITGLVHAYEALEDKSILTLALNAAKFIHKELYQSTTRVLLRSYCGSASDIEGFIDDYAYWIQALLDLYEVTLDEQWLEWAYALQHKQNELFYDTQDGGYFNVSVTDKTLLLRMKEEQDGAEPSANAISLRNLVRLGTLLEKSEWITLAKETAYAFKLSLTKFPFAIPALVASFMLVTFGLKEIVLAGADSANDQLKLFQNIVSHVFLPNKLVLYARPEGFVASHNSVVQQISRIPIKKNESVAYICENFACGLPIHDPEELKKAMSSHGQ
ncbi:spermatogenesis-associated protein 20 [Blakeslea trispora]|nr:spermatogenesis-associated protein 20 [Blakeslea trispora]